MRGFRCKLAGEAMNEFLSAPHAWQIKVHLYHLDRLKSSSASEASKAFDAPSSL